MAIQAIIVGLLGSFAGLIGLLVAIIVGVLLYLYKKGAKIEITSTKSPQEENDTPKTS